MVERCERMSDYATSPMSNCLNVDEVAAILLISKVSARKLCKDGTIPTVREGRRVVVPRESFFAWLNGGLQLFPEVSK
jgi:excisionase family DNA binding protein